MNANRSCKAVYHLFSGVTFEMVPIPKEIESLGFREILMKSSPYLAPVYNRIWITSNETAVYKTVATYYEIKILGYQF